MYLAAAAAKVLPIKNHVIVSGLAAVWPHSQHFYVFVDFFRFDVCSDSKQLRHEAQQRQTCTPWQSSTPLLRRTAISILESLGCIYHEFYSLTLVSRWLCAFLQSFYILRIRKKKRENSRLLLRYREEADVRAGHFSWEERRDSASQTEGPFVQRDNFETSILVAAFLGKGQAIHGAAAISNHNAGDFCRNSSMCAHWDRTHQESKITMGPEKSCRNKMFLEEISTNM
ncbi:hypothetical protein CEXT_369891 [Caerostris extrusa]|uniref:Uncharacterized protein n=1 Tax=Caerostris extrusa TaxID=172846 RepID=A0AAV4UPS8_CAEEX|nr:hypothetical protein CEXT_369891 [Caerostris extrusa]